MGTGKKNTAGGYLRAQQGIVIGEILPEDVHELAHVVLEESREVNYIEVVEDPDDEEQVREEEVEVLLVLGVGVDEPVRGLGDLQEGPSELLQHELQLQHCIVGLVHGAVPLKNGLGSLQNAIHDHKVIELDPGNQLLIVMCFTRVT